MGLLPPFCPGPALFATQLEIGSCARSPLVCPCKGGITTKPLPTQGSSHRNGL